MKTMFKNRNLFLVISALAWFGTGCSRQFSQGPTGPIANNTPTQTATLTATPVATGSSTPTVSLTPSVTNTPTYTYTPAGTATWTLTPTVSYTPTYTLTPTWTIEGTPTSTLPSTPTVTSTQTSTLTPVTDPGTPTSTITFAFTSTSTPTPTCTGTPTSTWTGTWYSSTPTITNTPTITLSPTQTATPTWTGAWNTFTPTETYTPLCYPPATFGNTQPGSATTSFNTLGAGKVDLSEPATLFNLSACMVPGQGSYDLILALYGDASGSPSTLIAQSAVYSGTAGNWVTLPVPPTYLAPGNYWIAVELTGNLSLYLSSNPVSSQTLYNLSAPFGTLPSPLPAGYLSNYNLAVYGSYCPGSSNPASPSPTYTFTPTPTDTFTSVPDPGTPTETYTPTSSFTPGGPTATITPTWAPPTETATPAWTSTLTPTLSPTKIFTFTPTGTWYTATPTSTNTPNATATACLGGPVLGDNIGTAADQSGSNQLNVMRSLAPLNTSITNMSTYVSAGSVYAVAIYADNGSGTAPTNLLTQSGPQTAVSTGWNNCTVYPTLSVTSGTYYWVAEIVQTGYYGIDYVNGGSNGGYQYPVTVASLPDPYTGGAFLCTAPCCPYCTHFLSLYASGCPFIPLTVSPTPTASYTPTDTPTSTPTITGTINTPTITFTPTPTAT